MKHFAIKSAVLGLSVAVLGLISVAPRISHSLEADEDPSNIGNQADANEEFNQAYNNAFNEQAFQQLTDSGGEEDSGSCG